MFDINDLPTLHRMQAAARRIDAMVHARACREYGLAFGRERCRELDMCIIHNSLVSRANGKQWPEINYHHMRKAAWIIENGHRASRLVNAWYRRKCGLPAQS